MKKVKKAIKNDLIEVLADDPSLFYFLQEKATDGILILNIEDHSDFWLDSKLVKNLGYNNLREINELSDIMNVFDENFLKLNQIINNKTYGKVSNLKLNLKLQHQQGSIINTNTDCKFQVTRSDEGPLIKLIAAFKVFDSTRRNKVFTIKQLKRYSHIVEGTNIGLWEWNIHNDEIIFHPQWAKVLGYTLNELQPINSNIWNKLVHPKDRKKRDYTLQKHLTGKIDFHKCEYRMKHKNGKWIWLQEKGKIVSWTDDGSAEWMTGFHEEITDAKERLLRKKSFIDHAPTAIAMFDKKMNYIAVSKRWLEDYQLENKDVIGKNHYELIPGSEEIWKPIHQKGLKGENLKMEEECIEHGNGQKTWVSWEVKPWFDHGEEIAGIIMHTADITQRKNLEEEAKEKQNFLETILANINVGIISCNKEGRLTLFNKATREWHGLPPEDIDPADFPSYYGLFKADGKTPMTTEEIPLIKTLQNGNLENEEMVIKPVNGEPKNIVVNGSQLKDASGNLSGAVVALHDITKSKQAEENLIKTIAKLEAILEFSTKTIIVGTDLTGTVTFLNKGAEQMLGYTQEEIVHRGNPGMFHISEELHELQAELLKTTNKKLEGFDLFKELVRQDQSARNWTLKRKDGSTFPVLLTITHIIEKGKVVGYLGVGVDISDLKKVENEIKSILKIARSQNERLKNFAHIVSHNLRSHSGNIEMLLELILEEDPSIKDNEMMQHLYKAGKNLKDTISHLNEVVIMNTSVKNSLTNLNISRYIETAHENIKAQASENNVTIENQVPKDLNVQGVPAYLDSILLNFLSNAIKYRDPDKESYIRCISYIEDKHVVIEVQDNGLGIDLVKHRRKLFGMYKTFHTHKDARGIGLFITKNQIEAMDGKIDVESMPGVGTTFKIYLKRAK